MRPSIHRLGRVVVSKPIRDMLHRRGTEAVDVEERDRVVEVRPAATEVRTVDTPEGPVAQPVEELPPLTDERVRETLEQVRH